MNIRCWHCTGRHTSVDEVRQCANDQYEAEQEMLAEAAAVQQHNWTYFGEVMAESNREENYVLEMQA